MFQPRNREAVYGVIGLIAPSQQKAIVSIQTSETIAGHQSQFGKKRNPEGTLHPRCTGVSETKCIKTHQNAAIRSNTQHFGMLRFAGDCCACPPLVIIGVQQLGDVQTIFLRNATQQQNDAASCRRTTEHSSHATVIRRACSTAAAALAMLTRTRRKGAAIAQPDHRRPHVSTATRRSRATRPTVGRASQRPAPSGKELAPQQVDQR